MLTDARASDVISVGPHFYIRAESSLADDRTRVLLDGDMFAVFDRMGDIQPLGLGQQGIFYRDTRHLSRLQMEICGHRPLLLSSTVRADNLLLGVDLTNPDLTLESGQYLPRGTLHIYRRKFLRDGVCFDQITLHNYAQSAVVIELVFQAQADFADIFEVRGIKRAHRGSLQPPKTSPSEIAFVYGGLDGIERRTQIVCALPQCRIDCNSITISVGLEAHSEMTFSLDVICDHDTKNREAIPCAQALETLKAWEHLSPLAGVDIYTSNDQLNDWIYRSLADLRTMVATTEFGIYPYAGVPWFSTIFGRDGIITALEMLWLAPDLARGVLSCLAATQATEIDPERDAQPGKILHELRNGEMARTREVPFGRYYGSVDATPLFVLLAAEYYLRTADRDFLRGIWPNVEAALEWIDRYGDIDGDGFVEYDRQADTGLVQQGWKDSEDSVFHADGVLARGPIALCEVQGYVYAAKIGIAQVAEDFGMQERAEALRAQAAKLKSRFNTSFWSEEISMFALALDGQKKPCQVRSSNAGQCLFTGIASPLQARSITDFLLAPEMYSGWGIRTISSCEERYNPMSYHNGSVWPHDNALIAFGAIRETDKRLALVTLSRLLDLSSFVQLHRLPELICGFNRRAGKGPTNYPVACSPQAWAAGSVFLILQACLGVSISARDSKICLHHPALPDSIRRVQIRNLKVGGASLDLDFERHAHSVGVDIPHRIGEIEVLTVR